MTQKEQQVVDLLKSIETGATGPVAVVNANKYIQHNLAVADGLEGFGEVLAALPKGSARVNTVRVFEDGDVVVAHTEYNFFGPKIGFDIFRFEDGKIVEHWDNLQETAGPNPSGHSMTDGHTAVNDHDKTAANKTLVGDFVKDVLVNGRMDMLGSYIEGDNYVQHNPNIGDGLSGLGKAFEAMAKAGITLKFDKLHKVIGKGNFVLTVSEGSFAGKPSAFYDLFRVENAKIVEHWDTIEAIPAKAEWKNQNGKF
jgi:predicted SnoaL-like aldol condensation-catalyzing enzyme